MIKKSSVIFANQSLENSFNELDSSDKLKKSITKAIKDLEKNAFSGKQIPKRLIPKKYIKKYKINNLWKYNLQDGWRLIYSIIAPNKIEIISAILEWFDHKNYERRMKY